MTARHSKSVISSKLPIALKKTQTNAKTKKVIKIKVEAGKQ